jgi:hypothetical protein
MFQRSHDFVVAMSTADLFKKKIAKMLLTLSAFYVLFKKKYIKNVADSISLLRTFNKSAQNAL